MKKILLSLLFVGFAMTSFSQMSSWEVKWNFYSQRYEGLIILAGNVGTFRVLVKDKSSGKVLDTVDQTCTVTHYRDGSSEIECYNPKSKKGLDYSPDNFKIFSNGAMYQMDDSGNWSTQISMRQITDIYDLMAMKNKYGL